MTYGTGTTNYQYDNDGRLTTTTDGAGNTVGYEYDDGGRLTTLTYPGQKSVTYHYDSADRMTSATDWNQKTTTFTWTGDSQLDLQATPDGITSVTDFDQNGQTTSVKLTAGPVNVGAFSYGYDN